MTLTDAIDRCIVSAERPQALPTIERPSLTAARKTGAARLR
ncbi:hypothetical protein [Frateuria sp. STR12]|nr:hypothetical protein [Frateuria sp. STR12]MCX7513392.1 hypothetical protein [Frateuria sp. STR12]